MDALHRRLLEIGFAAGDDLGLVLAGGYAMCAHELVNRPSQDIDFATATALPLPDVVIRLADAYARAGFAVQVVETTPRMARMLVSSGAASCEVDLLKEALGPPAHLNYGLSEAEVDELRDWALRWRRTSGAGWPTGNQARPELRTASGTATSTAPDCRVERVPRAGNTLLR